MEEKRENPSLTVIIPVYNGERWIPGILETLGRQTFKDFRAVIVDDGSTDSTPLLLTQAAEKDDRIKVIRSANRGLASARNLGLDHLATPWVTFLDIDDLLHPQAFELWMGEVSNAPKGTVVKSPWVEGTEPSESFFQRIKAGKREVWRPEEALGHFLYQSYPLTSACGALYDSGIFLNEGKGEGPVRFKDGLYYEDLEIGPRIIARASEVRYLDNKLYFYRQHPGSFIHTFSPRRLDALKVTDMVMEFVGNRYPALRAAAADRRWSANFNIFLLLSRSGEGRYEDVRQQCWERIREGRGAVLRNPRSRIKNKIGALLSYLGSGVISFLSRVKS